MSATQVTDGRMRDIHLNCQVGDLRDPYRGFVMNGAALIVGYCTGMVFTRRVALPARAGTLALILPLTIWASGAPLATAITAITAIVACRLPGGLSLPSALANLPVLRETSAGRGRARQAPPISVPAATARPAMGPRCQRRCLVARLGRPR